jgi:hypothetical protein
VATGRLAVLGGVRGFAQAGPAAGFTPAPAMGPVSAAAGGMGATVAQGTTPTTGSASLLKGPITSGKLHKYMVLGAAGFLVYLWWSLPK